MQVDTTACIRCKRSIIHIHCDSLNHHQLVLLVLLTIATGRLRLVLTARWCHDDVKGSRHGDVIKTVFQPIICNSHPFIPSSSSSSCVTWPVPDPPNSAALLQWYWERQSPPSQDMTFYIMSDWHDHTQCVGLVTKPINMERGAAAPPSSLSRRCSVAIRLLSYIYSVKWIKYVLKYDKLSTVWTARL